MKRILTLMLALVALAAGAQKYIPMLEKENVWKIHTQFEPNKPHEYSYSGGKFTITDTVHVPSEYTSEWKVRHLPKDDVFIKNNFGDVSHNWSFPYNFSAYDSVMVLDTSKEEVYKICTNPEHKANGSEDFRGAFILTEKDRKVYLSIQDNDYGCIVYNYLIYDFNVEEGDIVSVTNAALYTDNINHSRESYIARRHYSGYEWNQYYDVFHTHNRDALGPVPYIDCLLYRCWSPTYIPADNGQNYFSSAYSTKQVTLYCAKVEEHFIAGKNRRCLYFIRIDRPHTLAKTGYYYDPWYEYLHQYNSYICWIEGIGSAAGIMFNVNTQENRVRLYDERGVDTTASWIPTYETLSEGDRYTKCELVEFNGEPIQLDLITGFKEDWERIITACGINPALQGTEEKREGIYDLSGRRLHEEPASGIYIRNGKKYIKR